MKGKNTLSISMALLFTQTGKREYGPAPTRIKTRGKSARMWILAMWLRNDLISDLMPLPKQTNKKGIITTLPLCHYIKWIKWHMYVKFLAQ